MMGPSKHFLPIRTLIALASVACSATACYARVSVPLSNASGGAAWPGAATVSFPVDVLNDAFTYNPDLDLVNYASVPAGFLPNTAWNGGDTLFIGNNNDADNFWGADVSLNAGQTLDFIDIWGRSDYAGAEQSRHQNLVISFYNQPGGSTGGGTLLGASPEYSGVSAKAANNANGSAYGRFDVTTLLNATLRGQVKSFEITHGATNLNDFLLLTEVRAGTGAAAPALPTLTINRATGNMSLFNGPATPLNFIAYSVTSASGALKRASWNSVAATGDGNNGASLDADVWIEFTAPGATDNLSEGELPNGNGLTLNTGQTINLGNVWTKSPYEDLNIELLKADGTNAGVLVQYTGNGGNSYAVGDLNYDGAINAADWPLFRTGLGSVFTATTSKSQSYQSGDFDGDLDVDVIDFRRFETAYDGVNGAGAFAVTAAQVPEPATSLLAVSGVLAMVSTRRRRLAAMQCAAAAAVLMLTTGARTTQAQTFTLVAPPTGPVTANSEFNATYAAANLFDDAALTAADLGVKTYAGAPEYAGVGVGPMNVFFDNGSSVTANWIGFAQRTGAIATADRIGKLEFWFSNADFGAVIPATAPQATVTIADPLGSMFKPYPLFTQVSGRYTAMRMTIHDVSVGGPVNNIGGNELRLVQGPAPLTLQVNTSTGAMTIKNSVAGAQAVALDAYQISSSGGSLSTSWTGLGGLAGFPEGNGTGNGWEAGGGSNGKLLTEAYLLGGSQVSIGASLSLGNGFNSAVNAQDLKFAYSFDNSFMTEGIVEYVSTGGPAADFDGDGDVDGNDFLRWQRGVGTNSGATKAQGDADGNGAVNGADLTIWKSGFGTGGAVGATASVPEPTAGLLIVAGAIGLLAARRRGAASLSKQAAACACLLAVGSASIAGASTVDRDYKMGENSALSTENGSVGVVVGAGAGNFNPGFTLDHAGLGDVLPTFQDLGQFGSPVYANVGPSGTARPGAAVGALGITFDGVDDYLSGNGLGNPGEGDAPYESSLSYATLFTRAMQGWVRPTAASAAGQRQRVARDTLQFGISIVANAQGVNNWAMNLGGIAANNETVSSTLVALNQWTHVMQFANGNVAALYVNGVAVAAKVGFYGGNGATTEQQALALGADLAGNAPTVTASNFFKGQMDDFQVLVSGNNSTQTAGSNYGPFNLGIDNQYVASLGLVPGDVTGDGQITGNGTGGANDDVKKFVDNFLFRQTVNGVTVGDLNSRTQRADLNYDGVTDLRDWYILTTQYPAAAALDIAALVAGHGVPEPASAALVVVAGAALAGQARRRR